LFQRDRVLDGAKVLKLPLGAQCQPQRCDLCLGTLTDIGKRAVEHLPVGAIRLAQQMPRIRFVATGDVRGVDKYSLYI
jgi:hypothetical protein